jgi:aryl-alcohol dehydrogenase-like predicted oxidoreductase
MEYRPLGKTGLNVSALSFGASALGGVFRSVDESEAIRAVHAALDLGINTFDVAPAYGGTVAESVLGKALREVPRDRYFLSTKVGKTSEPGEYGSDTFDYSRDRIRRSIEESSERLGTDYFDVIHIHDPEYQGETSIQSALTEGFESVEELKSEGRVGAVSFGTYPMGLWHRIFETLPIDAALVHNHYTLYDTRLIELIPMAKEKGIGVINGSPFGSGTLTERGPPDWHPAQPDDRVIFRRATEFCRDQGASIAKLALQFSCGHPEIPTTLFSSANPESVRRNVQWLEEPRDESLLAEVRKILDPVRDIEWTY